MSDRRLARRAHRLAVMVGSAWLMAGCALLEPAAAHQLNLAGTSWRIVSLDGESLAGPRLSFPDLSEVVMEADCGTYRAAMALDTDGSAISFGEFADDPRTCPPSRVAFESDFVEALLTVEEWRVRSPDRIDLLGGSTMTLEREE